MNHTATVSIWKQTNRVARLWEDLAANSVAPDPYSMGDILPDGNREPDPPAPLVPALDPGLQSPWEIIPSSFPGRWQEIQAEERTFVERVGHGSIHLIQHALEALTAPHDETFPADSGQDEDPDGLPAASEDRVEELPIQAGYDPFPVMVKVSFEPEPPASVIETRRAVYGLKIPARPLHKRPIYQRLFFCLRTWVRKASGKSEVPRKNM
jgi:hypothetical protein